MLILCPKNVHFTFNEEVYKQTDGVSILSPLGPVLADFFIVELEKYQCYGNIWVLGNDMLMILFFCKNWDHHLYNSDTKQF